MSSAFAQVSVGDFHLSAHRILWMLFLELVDKGQPFDEMQVISILEQRQLLEQVGGSAYLFDCQMQGEHHDTQLITTPDTMMRTHAAAVINAARLRRYQLVGTALVKDSLAPRAAHELLQLKYTELFDKLGKGYDLDGNLTPVLPCAIKRRADIIRLDQVVAKEVEWLWHPFVPLGMLCMFSGDSGVGKTYLLLAFIALLTRGKLPGGQTCEPCDVLYLTLENSPEFLLRPRFDKLGGDATRFHLLRGSITGPDSDDDAQRGRICLDDVALLAEALERTKAKLVVIDPVQSFLGTEVDAYRANETRPILDGLTRLAERYNCAIAILRHLSKTAGGKPIYRGLGSIDFTAAARSEMVLEFVPNHPRKLRAMAHLLTNIGPIGASVGFSIDVRGDFFWEDAANITVEELLASHDAEEGSALREAVDYLREALAAGPRNSKEVTAEASELGITKRTLARARRQLKVKSSKSPEVDGEWSIQLPGKEGE
jgi:hypothetical protein